jgi:hypothetical protein
MLRVAGLECIVLIVGAHRSGDAQRAFVNDHGDARERWRDGLATAFPAGTYWLQSCN